MLRTIVDARALVALAMSAGVGLWGLRAYPFSHDDVFLGLIRERAPGVLSVLAYGYATLWFTTPYFAASLLLSLLAIVVYRRAPRARVRPLPPYPQPEQRPTPSLVLGERHAATTPGPAARPEWLTVPQRGLYTGVMILGAVGTGKTSACMYPYVDQLLRWKADDPARKLGGLGPGSERGLLRPGAGHAPPDGTRRRLRGGRTRDRRLLQPACTTNWTPTRWRMRWPPC